MDQAFILEEQALADFELARRHMKNAAERMLALATAKGNPAAKKRAARTHKAMARLIRDWNRIEHERGLDELPPRKIFGIAGWKMVPLEMTPTMIKAAHSADPLACDVDCAKDVYPPSYRAAVAEAPSHPLDRESAEMFEALLPFAKAMEIIEKSTLQRGRPDDLIAIDADNGWGNRAPITYGHLRRAHLVLKDVLK
jgi:hypothetical protein